MTRLNGMRHVEIHDPRVYAAKRILLVGVGTIGSHLAHTLARMQVPLILVDHDTVEEHNLATQTYGASDIGQTKVGAVKDQIQLFAPDAEVVAYRDRFPSPHRAIAEPYDIIVSAVDSLAARKKIAKALVAAGVDKPIIDGRVGREQVEVYYFPNAAAWLKQLPKKGDTDPCGARFTAYSANIAAGMMAGQIKRLLMGQKILAWRIIFDMASLIFLTEN